MNRREFIKNILRGSVPVLAGMNIFQSKLFSQETASDYIKIGNEALDNANYEKGIEALEKGMKLFPNNKDISKLLFESLRTFGDEKLSADEFKGAIELLKRAAQIKADDPYVLGLLGKANFNLGNRRESFDYCQSALKLNPDDTYSRWLKDYLSESPLPPKKASYQPPTYLEEEAEKEREQYVEVLQKKNNVKSESDLTKYNINRIVIDPGHGGFDDGAIGPSKTKEKDIVLKIARILEKQLSDGGKKVFLTRDDDYYLTLTERTALANRYRADIFVSLHCNCADTPNATGIETYYCAESATTADAERVAKFENSVAQQYDKETGEREAELDLQNLFIMSARKLYWKESAKYAKGIHKNLISNIGLKDRSVNGAKFYVLTNAKMPSLLIEFGFISNPNEERMLKSEELQIKAAKCVAASIL